MKPLRFCLPLSAFMVIMDSTIANVALPAIAGNIGASQSQSAWIISSFVAACALSVPLTRWLALRIGESHLFIAALSVFTLSSCGCGVSTNFLMLIFFRVIQGISAGPIIPLSQSLLLKLYKSDEKRDALAIWSMTAVVAPVIGPVIGGIITSYYAWNFVFLINLPLGILVVVMCRKTISNTSKNTQDKKFDFTGYLLICLLVALWQYISFRKNSGNDNGFLVIISLLLLLFFLISQMCRKNTLLDLSFFLNRNYAIGTLCIFFSYIINFGSLVPSTLFNIYNYDLVTIGLLCSPAGIAPLFLSKLSGRMCKYVDSRILISISFLIFAMCYYWRACYFSLGMTPLMFASSQFFIGIASTLFYIPLTEKLFSDISKDDLTAATTLRQLCRTLSTAFGTILTSELWNNRLFFHTSRLSEKVYAGSLEYENFYQKFKLLGLNQQETLLYIRDQISFHSKLLSLNDIYWLDAGIFLFLACFTWLLTPTKK
ncbi:DHA2 family efflux MFS transporter permease subunit [Erwinia typographi]|uniref:DHA2 family efflux MFS transporter permease subunit n=1 Tax=Erwinia typographi TaxID=371042 RepID=UPI00068EEE2B|nr:DHA2 family efflux MFS transporter permease subunit [Erwinia typographi]